MRRAGVVTVVVLQCFACDLGRCSAVDATPDAPFPKSEAAAVGVSTEALDRLVKEAEERRSDALVIIKDGKLLGEWYFGNKKGRIEAMSATKSVVSLAIGLLVDEGKIKSIDERVCTFYPEWKQGRKKQITVRHLLNHTSALQGDPTTQEIYAAPDFVQLALAAELSNAPGERFFYNNKAVNLLAGIVKKTSGRPMDDYVGEKLFGPLGITDFSWTRDRAGNPNGMSGLQIRPFDLARVGQLMLDEGEWRGRRVVSKEWVRASTTPSQRQVSTCGLLWWLIPEWINFTLDEKTLRAWRDGGLEPDFVKALEPFKGKTALRTELIAGLEKSLGPEAIYRMNESVTRKNLPSLRWTTGPIVGFAARGYLGQYLVVYPAERLIAVRMRRSSFADELSFLSFAGTGRKSPEFPEFETLVRLLIPKRKSGCPEHGNR